MAAAISNYRVTNKALITLGEYASLCMPLECMKKVGFTQHNKAHLAQTLLTATPLPTAPVNTIHFINRLHALSALPTPSLLTC